jgi:hypothetical protein
MTVSAELGAERSRSVRAGGLSCLIGAAIAAAGATWLAAAPSSVSPHRVSYPVTPAVFRFTEVLWTITHLLVLLGVIAWARSGLAGRSRAGRIGAWLAVAGMALLVPAEFGYVFAAGAAQNSPVDNALSDLFGVAVPLAGIGLVLAGVTTVRAGRWAGPGRYAPLLCGVLALVVLVPVPLARPSVFLWAIAVWNLAFIWFGWSVRQAARQPEPAAAPQAAGVR